MKIRYKRSFHAVNFKTSFVSSVIRFHVCAVQRTITTHEPQIRLEEN
jgi:hypothetical protein